MRHSIWFVFFSHPADFTPVCTTEFVAFQKRYEAFKALNYELIGMSVDQVFSHIKWEEWIKIRIILYYPQELRRNIDEILRAVKAMQISDKNGVAMPARWPDKELIGDKVIIPPAKDVKTAKERLEKAKKGEFECYDWWLCYKKMY